MKKSYESRRELFGNKKTIHVEKRVMRRANVPKSILCTHQEHGTRPMVFAVNVPIKEKKVGRIWTEM